MIPKHSPRTITFSRKVWEVCGFANYRRQGGIFLPWLVSFSHDCCFEPSNVSSAKIPVEVPRFCRVGLQVGDGIFCAPTGGTLCRVAKLQPLSRLTFYRQTLCVGVSDIRDFFNLEWKSTDRSVLGDSIRKNWTVVYRRADRSRNGTRVSFL